MSDRVIIFGSRHWFDAHYIWRQLVLLPRDAIIVHGACRTGADAYADQYATECGHTVERYPADWAAYGRAAGPRRNLQMAERGATRALGFRTLGKSNGTDDMARACALFGIPVVRHGWWP